MQGPILAFIYAVKEMLEEGQGPHGSLPVNVAFVFEGEEENGMQALQPHIADTVLTPSWITAPDAVHSEHGCLDGLAVTCMVFCCGQLMAGIRCYSLPAEGW